MSASLVGSEMCIRDSSIRERFGDHELATAPDIANLWPRRITNQEGGGMAVSYTHLTLPTICSV
eukprot:11336452-Alexandrium_andersonii.AAC.1